MGFQPVIANLRQPRRLSALTGQEACLPTAVAAKFTTPTAPPLPAAAGMARASRARSDGAPPFPAIWRAVPQSGRRTFPKQVARLLGRIGLQPALANLRQPPRPS